MKVYLCGFALIWITLFSAFHTYGAPSTSSGSWKSPSAGDVKEDLEIWLDKIGADQETRTKVLDHWNAEKKPGNPLEIYNATLDSLRVFPEVVEFMNSCDNFEWNQLQFGKEVAIPNLPDSLKFGNEGVSKRLPGTLKLYLAHRLIRAHLYDEAKEILDEFDPENSIDPAAILISKSIACNRLLEKKEGIEALNLFKAVAEDETGTPRRYPELAKLLEDELDNIKEDEQDLDNIGRRMQDIQRRLSLGKTCEKVQKVEKDVIESLDKLIEKLEKECQGGQQSNDSIRSNRPPDELKLMGGKAPGNVDRKNLGNSDGWGDLPPKEREEALLKIEKEFPSHYRDIITEYFREMAGIED